MAGPNNKTCAFVHLYGPTNHNSTIEKVKKLDIDPFAGMSEAESVIGFLRIAGENSTRANFASTRSVFLYSVY